MKKFLSALLFLVMLFTLLPQGAMASQVKAATYSDFTYSISGGKVTITDFNENFSGELVIPSTIDGYPVTTIGMTAFSSCVGITSLTIPSTVTKIELGAFYNCAGLQQLVIPDSVTVMEKCVFQDCWNIESLVTPQIFGGYIGYLFGANLYSSNDSYTPSRLKYVYLTNSCDYIPDYAFYGLDGLEYVMIPNSVITIGKGAFKYCSAIEKIIIPDSVLSIGNDGFTDAIS